MEDSGWNQNEPWPHGKSKDNIEILKRDLTKVLKTNSLDLPFYDRKTHIMDCERLDQICAIIFYEGNLKSSKNQRHDDP